MSVSIMPEIRVSLDIGCRNHSVAVGLSDGKLLDEFDISHTKEGFELFFKKINYQEIKAPSTSIYRYGGLQRLREAFRSNDKG